MAREVLYPVEPEIFEPLLAMIKQQEAAARPVPRTQPFGDLVTRYRAGEHVAVWESLRSLPAIEGDMRKEALAVAEETMRRVTHNVHLLADRLKDRGWESYQGKFITKPTPEDSSIIARIEELGRSPIPPSLLAFWQIVGGVDFVWWDYLNGNRERKPPELIAGLDLGRLDPLRIGDPTYAAYEFEGWEESTESMHPDLFPPYTTPLSPDDLIKAGISGGGPYSIELPFAGADPVLKYEPHWLPFVDYLRLALRWAGFPGLEKYTHDNTLISELVRTLTAGFEPF